MKTISIKKISLSNWKGKTNSVLFDGNSIISGFNGSGKTLLLKAWTWLLTGYTDENSPKNSELFNNKEEITENTPTAEIEAIISIDGEEYTLKKTAKAKFTRDKEDGAMKKASSDEYGFFIDGISRTSTEYNSFISSNIIDTDILPYCINGNFFTVLAENDKDKARKLLSAIVGDINDDDLRGNYNNIISLLKKQSLNDIKAHCKTSRLNIEKRNASIPLMLEEKIGEKEELEQNDFNGILKSIESKNEEIKQLDDKLLGLSDEIKPIIDKKNSILSEISNKKEEIDRERRLHDKKQSDLLFDIESKKGDIEYENFQIESDNEKLIRGRDFTKTEIDNLSRKLSIKNEQIEDLRKKNNEIKNRVFTIYKCSYCGQELPQDMIDEFKNNFNKNKITERNAVVDLGKTCAAEIEAIKKEIEYLTEKVESCPKEKDLLSMEDLNEEEKKIKSDFIPFENTEKYKILLSEMEELEKNIPSIPNIDSNEINESKKILMSEIQELNRTYGLKNRLDSLISEIESLRNEQKKNAIEVAKLLGIENEAKEYEREKASIISERIDGNLLYSSIIMQRIQKNGDITDDCIITDKDGVKYSTINGAKRVLIATDVQNMFCKHYDVSIPIWVDNCSIIDAKNRPIYNDTQMIYILNNEEKFSINKLV